MCLQRASALLVLALALAACAVPATDARVVETLPDRELFAPVARVLVRHCGTLDCHGSVARNLRLYGDEGLRWARSDRPLMPECTTADELEQDYTSLVGLEPETLSAVVAEHGARPERLTFVRKALGLEAHDGGTVFQPDSDGDVCLRSWLTGQTDVDACQRAVPASDCL